MLPKSRMTPVIVVLCVVLGTCVGCSSTIMRPDSGGDMPSVPPAGTSIEPTQVEALLARLTQLQGVSQEALEAVMAIGATSRELLEAQQSWASAEQAWQEGYQAYEVGQYQASWQKLQTAEVAYKGAEERAIHAGLDHIERELALEYTHMFPVDVPRADVRRDSVQVVEEAVSLRNRAGPHAQIVGKVHAGQLLRVLAKVGEWYWVQTEQGTVGWVSKNLVVDVQ